MSGDNALVIGMVARGLPRAQRRKAIAIGAGGAVALRVAAAAIVTLLLTVRYLQLIGGLALVVIAYRLVRPETNRGSAPRPVTTLRAAVVTILAADFAMSLENILGVGAGATRGARNRARATLRGRARRPPGAARLVSEPRRPPRPRRSGVRRGVVGARIVTRGVQLFGSPVSTPRA